ncbi:MAG TPA: AAA family ATPase [Ktedonosporobacter sp.]|nr:AAA family ATPase [Ktedonosporobacter sp.]
MGKRTIIIIRGLPGSGKSTWARQQLEQHPERYKRLNRDTLREMIDNGKWSKGREKHIIQTEKLLAEHFLSNGFTVIIDDTNLSESTVKMWREFAQKMEAAVEIKDFTHVPVEVCIERDRKRPNYVGEQVIREMYREFLQPKPLVIAYDPTLPDALICDLDGTLALLNGRNPYDASTCENDLLNEPIANIVSTYYDDGYTILLVSGRSSLHRPPTERWLQSKGIRYHTLLMRSEGDSRKDAIIKKEIYEQHIRGKWNIKFILDDRNQVIRAWRELGLTVLQVADGDF